MKRVLLLFCLILLMVEGFAQILDSSIINQKKLIDSIRIVQKRNQNSFSVDGYVKNDLILNHKPDKFLGKNTKDYIRLRNGELLWLSEVGSKFYFDDKRGFKEQINRDQTFGKYPSYDFDAAKKLYINFSNQLIKIESISDKYFISPFGRNAQKYYDFELQGIKNDDALIRIIPKHRYGPLFRGTFVLDTMSYQLKQFDFKLNGKQGIDFIDSLNIKQKFDNTNRLIFSEVGFKGNFLKFKFSGKAKAYFSGYENNIPENLTFEKHEVLIEDRKNITNFSNKDRTVPLTLQERLSYEYQHHQASEKDSIQRLIQRPKLFPLLFDEKIWSSKPRHQTIIFDPIVPAFFYNTIEGLGINYGVNFIRYSKSNKYWSVNPRIRYGFNNKELNSDISLTRLFNPSRRGLWNVSFGSTYQDLNPNGSLNSLQNSINTLLFEQNFMKLYRKKYVSSSVGTEILNGLYWSVGVELSRNISVDNQFDYSFRGIKWRNFSSNNPLSPDQQSKLFPDHQALFVNTSLIYSFNQDYENRNGEKIFYLPKGPRLILNYRKGIPKLFNSSSNYQFAEIELQQEKLDCGLWGYGSYSISTGRFFQAKNVYFPEWKHFIGNLALVFNPGLKNFHLLNFYTYSTNEYFAEAHFEHNFNMKFTSRIPLIRNLKVQELIGGAYLYQPQKGNYFEVYGGFKKRMFRIDYAMSFDSFGKLNQGFKLSYDF
nr:hypothetical protein [Pseudopedobacter sp.]